MQDREAPATPEKKIAFLVAITLLAGTAVLGVAGWTTLGWVMVGEGLAMLLYLGNAPLAFSRKCAIMKLA